ncbi:MAG TPA: hypothetical protein VLS93_18945, partial [Anaeromyxobacteraceae bacterium]|nr:hypothetical protein [Anaeromyxobacteraceae bacterium]
MRTALLLTIALALAAPTGAAAQSGTSMHGSPSRPARKVEKKKEAAAGPQKAAAGKPSPEQLSAVARTKSIFVFAVESCDRPDRCDASLRDDAERRFLDACRVCAPPERCEAERDAIRQGTAKR